MDVVIPATEDPEEGGVANRCPFCGRVLEGHPNRCPGCGKIIGESAQDIKRLGAAERRTLQRRKMFADLAFLVGLVVGGPLIAGGEHVRLGLFLVLAGGLSSAVHRYLGTSEPATVLISGLSAAVLAIAVTNPSESPSEEQNEASEAARGAFLGALSADLEPLGGLVEGRGLGQTVAWFHLPAEMIGECGSHPPAEIRRHLAELGVHRVVIANETEGTGICSFSP